MKKPVVALALASVAALTLAGCSTPSAGEGDDGTITVVASTNVYGDIAATIGGDRVDVQSIITSASQDPHSYEASARDRLAVQKADLVIENGGGYDAFIDTLLQDAKDPHVVTAVEYSHDFPGNEGHDEAGHDHADESASAAPEESDAPEDEAHDHADDEAGHEGHDHIEGFNEHVWFDPHTMIHVVEAIADELTELDPDGAKEFAANAATLTADLEGFETELATLKTEAPDVDVFITEPLPGYLAAAAGFTDVTPDGFAESVEEGTDVAPAVLLQALDVIGSGQVTALLTNAQTGGSETQRVETAAKDAGIPIVAFTELLEDGSSYSEWMSDAIQSLAAAVKS
ncbi:zinc ABC transporter substrate-binding protein [Microbacterium sp. STF-2]|uniref:metal ABC transporter solute-binding protein, Zn/Mn family n=1 Tax=unclassified Microbacterium TaxID=2609290 RepID=UPI002616D334|nr:MULTISPECIES: zinc ABC transporter substrate-binding protein [unclassified Microbacterium]MCV0334786.1 zinc ABC transporter substrate-binding protein [Microbacterium sp.]MCV0374035.1 zinc ABC transporter substrate-binding protein [Microbacterium sp.]MCV0391246.1 zinc ABC transporter substrate-binding protein [Microbacterium sp.]MCV0418641.1 zinc ABC transporter substrate-binding protein [Microbacterium sp.]MCV0423086.1 zinc ABC transporter substrate-binding protein [Microbacterium sp.]